MKYLKYIEAIAAILLVAKDLVVRLVPDIVHMGLDLLRALNDAKARVVRIWREAE